MIRVQDGLAALPNTPAELVVDLVALGRSAGLAAPPDGGSLRVEGLDPETGAWTAADFRISEDFRVGPRGRVQWVIPAPGWREFRLVFSPGSGAPPVRPSYIPAIGIGDEILSNSAAPAPAVAMSALLLVDWNGDGTADALAINHYCDRFGRPWDGLFVHPGTGTDAAGLHVGSSRRLYIQPHAAATDGGVTPRPLHALYNWGCPVDWDADGLPDLLYISMAGDATPSAIAASAPAFPSADFVTFFRNTGGRDAAGLPVLEEAKRYPAMEITRNAYVPMIAAEDLDGDGRRDLVAVRTSPDDGTKRRVTAFFYRCLGADAHGLPELDPPAALCLVDGATVRLTHSAHTVSFGDVDGDGRIDIVGNDLATREVYWFANAGGRPPRFDARPGIEGLPEDAAGYRWARWSGGEGLLGKTGSTLWLRTRGGAEPRFSASGSVLESGGPLRGGLQEKPEWVDWDADGDQDLLAGESHGFIHLYLNSGDSRRPRFDPAVRVEADGRPLRIYRDGVFGGQHWHGMMGYPSPVCVDWDRDGRFDLVVPNETNRVFWFRNIGQAGRPRFGAARQILPDGFADSPAGLEQSRVLSADRSVANHPYPYESGSPFFWRTRLAVADYTGDGLEDLVGLNGVKDLVLYERYRARSGELRLRPARELRYEDGAPIRRPRYFKLREADWDGDGLIDLIATQNLFGEDRRSLLFLKNVGTREEPVFRQPVGLALWGETISFSSHGLQPSVLDFDGDGSPDIVAGTESGYFILFRHAALTRPKPDAALGPVRRLR